MSLDAIVTFVPGYSTSYNTPSLFKSSAKDLSVVIFDLGSISILDFGSLSTSAVLLHLSALGRRSACYRQQAPCSCLTKIILWYLSLLSSMNSDLEACSHNPTGGSFGLLPFQVSPNANCLD